MSEREDKTSALEVFPFMQAFPYDEYEFSIEKADRSNEISGINPIIIEEAGKMVEPDIINFYTLSELTSISLSFYTYDIKYIESRADSIKKFDKLSSMLNDGLITNSFILKIKAIKEGEKFLKKIGSGLTAVESFNKILLELLNISEISLNINDLKAIKKMDLKLDQEKFSEEEQEIICEYFNFHIHHIRILLGIIIAIKIH